MTARWKGGGGELTQGHLLTKRKITPGIVRGAQLLCAEQVLAEYRLLAATHGASEGNPVLVKGYLREVLDELGILVDTRGVKAKRGPHALDDDEGEGAA